MKDLFNLQRFSDEGADAPAGSEGGQAPEGKGTDEKPVFTEAQQEYINKLLAGRAARAAKEANQKAEADRLQALSESERQAEELKQALADLKKMKAEKERADMISAARSDLQAKGYSFSDEVIAQLITDDAETTKSRLDTFVSDFEKALNAKLQSSVQSTTPKAGVKSADWLTKKQILEVKSRQERQKLIKENLDLFQ